MAGAASASYAAGKLTISGSGFVLPDVIVAVTFASTVAGKRNYVETYRTGVNVGSITIDVGVPHAAGTITVRVCDPATGAVLATATGVSV